MKITVEDGSQISKEAIEELQKHTDMIECQCPARLIQLLEMVRDFTDYTTECIDKYPDDEATHRWLRSSSLNIDQLLSTTLIQLARMEGFINEHNEIVKRSSS